MTTNKEANNIAPSRNSQPSPECCMCGDYGVSNELFHCKVCQFRSQHRHCSNLYPKAESSYQVCNWCLSPKAEKEKSQNSSNSSSSNKTTSEYDSKNRRSKSSAHGGLKGERSILQLLLNKPIKKQRSPERSPPTRKRIITNGALEEKLRRTKSEEIPNHRGIRKPVLRNKVRRYKLLDEVSS